MLGKLPRNELSPMKRVKGTHMARFVVVPHLRNRAGKPLDHTAYLLFGSEFDGPANDYLVAFAHLPEARRVFGHCAGYEDDGNPETLVDYLADYSVRPGYSVVAYPNAGLGEVRSALDLRRDLNDFVVRTRGYDALALRQEWLATFADRS
jgi:hypothetical protein